MHALLKFLLLALVMCHGGTTVWLLVRPPVSDSSGPPAEKEPQVNPTVNARFQRLRIGMTLKEAEAIMEPAGLSLSSDINVDYHIWKDKGGWVSVFVERGRLTKTHIRPAPPE